MKLTDSQRVGDLPQILSAFVSDSAYGEAFAGQGQQTLAELVSDLVYVYDDISHR